MMTSGGRSSSRYPFTASQWQELEQQALIFKYMASGHPIPSDLILHIRRSFLLDSITTTSPTLPFAPHPTLGWSCYQMGFGRKAEDPEPGRCRRTDGKKWRCSKEAYPDSKYCERHMHRGKNRSRKPVEMSHLTTTPAAAAVVPSSSQPPPPAPLSLSTQPETYHLMYPYPSYSTSRTPGSVGLHPLQHNTTHFTPYSSADKNYRYCHGVKDADEYTFFSEGSGAERGSLLCLGEPKEGHALQQGSYNFTTELSKEVGEKQQQQQHCFVLGADFKLEKPMKEEREEEAQRPLRHFFDEWPQKSRESWMDLEEGGRSNQGSYSKTQLSISIPMAHHDFMVSGSRYRNDD